MSEHYDVLIRGGTLYDGTGAPGARGAVAIRGGRIAAVGDVAGDADRVLDVDGLAVSPGFVDIHTHYDAQVFWDRMLTISPWHGVTSVVMGNCGFGIAPTRPEHRDLILRTLENVEGMSLEALRAGTGDDWGFESFPEYLDAVEARGPAINVGALIGHTPLRMYVLGEEATEREATPQEVARMRELVREAVLAGALGFASSKAPTHVGYAGKPVPSRAAHVDEIRALAGALSDCGRGLMQATVGKGFFVEELAAIARETGRPLSWTALLATGGDMHRKVLARHAELQAAGIEVVPQVSCRPLNFEFQFSKPFPYESLPFFQPVSAADREGKKRLYADPAWRQQWKQHRGGVISGKWQDTVVAQLASDPGLEERAVAEIAAERGLHPIDLVLDLALASDLEARFRVAALNTDEEVIAELLQHPSVVLGLSDAGAHASQLCDACFSTHLLSHWVREKQVIDLPRAVHLLTDRAAEVFGITDRGRLAPGLAADIAIWDPERVGCSKLRRVHDQPAGADRLISEAEGIEAVIVNGTLLRHGGKDQLDPEGPLPGRLLRGGAAA